MIISSVFASDIFLYVFYLFFLEWIQNFIKNLPLLLLTHLRTQIINKHILTLHTELILYPENVILLNLILLQIVISAHILF